MSSAWTTFRTFIGFPSRTVLFRRTLDALPPGTEVLQSSDSDHDPLLRRGLAAYILGFVVAGMLASTVPVLFVIVVAGMLLGVAHGLSDAGGVALRCIRLMVLPAVLLAFTLVFDPITPESEALAAVGVLVLPPLAGFAAAPVLRGVWRSKQTIGDAQPMPGWLRRATDSGRAVALLRRYPRHEGGEARLAQDRATLAQLGYELADTVRVGEQHEPNLAVGLMEVLLSDSGAGSDREERLILALFVKASVLHRNARMSH